MVLETALYCFFWEFAVLCAILKLKTFLGYQADIVITGVGRAKFFGMSIFKQSVVVDRYSTKMAVYVERRL